MAAKKIYAIVFPNGRHEILEANWDKVRVIVEGISGISYKGFTDKEEAENWAALTKSQNEKAIIKKKAMKQEKERNNLSKMELISKNTNSPYWNKIRDSKKRIVTE